MDVRRLRLLRELADRGTVTAVANALSYTPSSVSQQIRALQADHGTSLVLITHDLGVVAETAHRVAVMYGGQIVEEAPVEELFADPKHPYTQGLLGSIPVIGVRHDELTVIRGRVPTLIDPPPGCRFADRCPERMDVCTQATPALVEIEHGRTVRCFLHSDATVEDVPVKVGARP